MCRSSAIPPLSVGQRAQEPAYPDLFMAFMSGNMPSGLSEKDLQAALKNLAKGLPSTDLGVDPDRTFYILGLAPNAAGSLSDSFCGTASAG